MAKSIMVQGTMSNAGKSILAGGLCRVFKQDGYRVAPFKSQNMALNSFITEEGLEMGRAQVMQAEAAGIAPSVYMNPILLKPTNDTGSQVIVNGEAIGVMSAVEYFRRKKNYIPAILDAYHKLEAEYDIIVIEGAGSPAEINLKKDDIVNMGLAELVDAPVLLVGDIDRGGVFAQIVGTIELLEERERKRICGTVINKFRGDKEILKPGLMMLEERTHIPVTGVIPYFYLEIDDEDSLTERFENKAVKGEVDIVVIRLPRISNFTDFHVLECMEGVSVRYVSSISEFGDPNAVLLPGSKNTIADLLWMRQNGLEAKVLRHASQKKLVFGICGGYQMLGQSIEDAKGLEQKGRIKGMGLLPVKTVFKENKTRTRVKAVFGPVGGILSGLSGMEAEGYEIHNGSSVYMEEFTDPGGTLLLLQNETEKPQNVSAEAAVNCETVCEQKHKKISDGAWAGNIYGCYVHGIFDSPEVSAKVISALRKEKGLDPDTVKKIDWKTYKEEQYDKLADIIRENLDMDAVYRILNEQDR